MLNRRHLRIKVFQAIYSYLRGAKNDLGVGERELLKSIDRIHELFVLHVSVFTQLQSFASKRVEERKNKKLPSEEDLNPNLRFVDNEVLNALTNSIPLQKKVEEYKISWTNNSDIIQKLFKSIEESDTYQKYMDSLDFDIEIQNSHSGPSKISLGRPIYPQQARQKRVVRICAENAPIHFGVGF